MPVHPARAARRRACATRLVAMPDQNAGTPSDEATHSKAGELGTGGAAKTGATNSRAAVARTCSIVWSARRAWMM